MTAGWRTASEEGALCSRKTIQTTAEVALNTVADGDGVLGWTPKETLTRSGRELIRATAELRVQAVNDQLLCKKKNSALC